MLHNLDMCMKRPWIRELHVNIVPVTDIILLLYCEDQVRTESAVQPDSHWLLLVRTGAHTDISKGSGVIGHVCWTAAVNSTERVRVSTQMDRYRGERKKPDPSSKIEQWRERERHAGKGKQKSGASEDEKSDFLESHLWKHSWSVCVCVCVYVCVCVCVCLCLCVCVCASGDFTIPPYDSNTGQRSFCDSAYRSILHSYCRDNSLLSSRKSALITPANVHSERNNSSKHEHSDITL